MSQKKLVIDYAARDPAHRCAGFLQELFLPTPDAVTVFEDSWEMDIGAAKSWRVEAYFNAIVDQDALLQTVSTTLDTGTATVQLQDVPEKNWVALSQAALPPVRAGRFTVYGSHDRHRIPDGPHAILIDAGEAFGTAHHATTFGCLLAIDRITRTASISDALDLGCGSAVLSIALARAKPAARIFASDLDHQSIAVATANVRRNRASKQISTRVANGLRHPDLRRRFDLVIANILAGPLLDLAPDIAMAVTTGGHLMLSGILNAQSSEIEARYRSFGFVVCSKLQIDGWTTLTFVKQTVHPKNAQVSLLHVSNH